MKALETIKLYTERLERDPSDINTQIRLIEAYINIGDLQNGVRQLENFLQRYPSNIWALDLIGQSLFYLNKYTDTLTYLQQANNLYPHNDGSYIPRAAQMRS